MLKKPHRLKERSRFAELRRQGRSSKHPLAVLIWLANESSQTRFGFAVSRRIGGAVKRNRVRRLLREAVRLRIANIAPGVDVLVIARTPIREASFSEVQQAIDSLLRQSGLVRHEASQPAVAPSPASGPSSDEDHGVDVDQTL